MKDEANRHEDGYKTLWARKCMMEGAGKRSGACVENPEALNSTFAIQTFFINFIYFFPSFAYF